MDKSNLLPDGDPERFEMVMGFDLAIWEAGHSQFRVKLGPQHKNRQGAPHGGVVAALIDAAGMFAGNTDPDTGANVKAVTVSMSCNFIGAPKADELVCEGRVLRSGRSMFFTESRLTDGDGGPLLATGQGAYKFIR